MTSPRQTRVKFQTVDINNDDASNPTTEYNCRVEENETTQDQDEVLYPYYYFS